MSNIIKTCAINLTAPPGEDGILYTTASFENIPAGRGYTFVTEIIKVLLCASLEPQWMMLNRGDQTWDAGNQATFGFNATVDPMIICTFTSSGQNTGLTFDLTDGAGNGLIVPENSLTLTMSIASSGEEGVPTINNGVLILYKMRKIKNNELLTLMINQGSAKN